MTPDGDGVAIAGVRLTSPDRVLFAELVLTKEALARYYDSIAEWILPDLKNRPLSLVRCPQGPDEGCFFQKHIDAAWSSEIERATVPESDGEGIYAVANSAAALVGLVKMAKRERTGRIFIDYLRNSPGATTVAAYSVRARKGAPVSTPLHWDELGPRMKPTAYHAGNVARRLRGLHSDPWKAFRRKAQALTAAMKRKFAVDA